MGKVGVSVLAGLIACAASPAPAAAKSAAAMAEDAATIRRLNREQLDHVRSRDAQYAQGWRDYEAARRGRDAQDAAEAPSDYTEARAAYAQDRRRYEAEMREWREAVAACRAGDYARCDG